MRTRLLTLGFSLCTFLTTPAWSITPLNPDSVQYSVPTTEVAQNASVEIPLLIDTVNAPTTGFISLVAFQSPSLDLQISDIRAGAGLQSFIDGGGSASPDFVADPVQNSARLVVSLAGFDSSVNGRELAILTVTTTSPVGSTFDLSYFAPESFLDPTNISVTTVPLTVTPQRQLIRGDANDDGNLNIADAILILDVLFEDQPTECIDALDVNDSGTLSLSDPLNLLSALFVPGSTPPAATCETDTTDDAFPDCQPRLACP